MDPLPGGCGPFDSVIERHGDVRTALEVHETIWLIQTPFWQREGLLLPWAFGLCSG